MKNSNAHQSSEYDDVFLKLITLEDKIEINYESLLIIIENELVSQKTMIEGLGKILYLPNTEINNKIFNLLIDIEISNPDQIYHICEIAIKNNNYSATQQLLAKYAKQIDVEFLLSANIDDIDKDCLSIIFHQFKISDELISKIFMHILNTGDPKNLLALLKEYKIDKIKAFENADYINWNSELTQQYAIEMGHPCSEIIKVLKERLDSLNNLDPENFDINSFDTAKYKECFYKAKELRKISLDIDKIMSSLFKITTNDTMKKNILFTITKEIIEETPREEHKDLVKWFNIFGIKFSFVNSDNILLTSQSLQYEADNLGELFKRNNYKEKCKVSFSDGKIFNEKGEVKIAPGEEETYIYVVDKKGNFYINIQQYPMNHSHFLRGFNQKNKLEEISLFGYGKPVSCGGQLSISNGKIWKIDNQSGHYQPDDNMLKQVCKNLLECQILAEHTKITFFSHEETNLDTIREFNVTEVLGDYPFLDY